MALFHVDSVKVAPLSVASVQVAPADGDSINWTLIHMEAVIMAPTQTLSKYNQPTRPWSKWHPLMWPWVAWLTSLRILYHHLRQ